VAVGVGAESSNMEEQRMRRASCALVAAIALVLSTPASAAEPSAVVTPVDRTTVIPAGAVCSFPLQIHTEGTRRVTTYYDNEENVVRTANHLASFSITYTNSTTARRSGRSSRPADRGALPDGTVLVTIPPGTTGCSCSAARARSTRTPG